MTYMRTMIMIEDYNIPLSVARRLAGLDDWREQAGKWADQEVLHPMSNPVGWQQERQRYIERLDQQRRALVERLRPVRQKYPRVVQERSSPESIEDYLRRYSGNWEDIVVRIQQEEE